MRKSIDRTKIVDDTDNMWWLTADSVVVGKDARDNQCGLTDWERVMIQNICLEQRVNILYQISLFIKQSGRVELDNQTPLPI